MDCRAIDSAEISVYGGVHIPADVVSDGADEPVEPSTALRRPAVDELDTYARAAARLARLEIDEAWWPGVLLHLKVLCDNAALVEAIDLAGPPAGPATTPS
jgi:hypothetical protein